MCNKCLFVFFAGALAFHTLGHIMLAFSNLLPLHAFGFILTPNLNNVIIIGSALLTIWCLYMARGYTCKCNMRK